MRRLKADDLKDLSDAELEQVKRTIRGKTLTKAVLILIVIALACWVTQLADIALPTVILGFAVLAIIFFVLPRM